MFTKQKDMLLEVLSQLSQVTEMASVPFTEYLTEWLEESRMNLMENTYNGYHLILRVHLIPYFKETKIALGELTAQHIQEYYRYKSGLGSSNNTLLHHHNVLHAALEKACIKGFILRNPADYLAEKPKYVPYHPKIYLIEELHQLFRIFEGHILEIPVLLAACLGLRREEVVGLKWEDIDFGAETLTIQRTVVLSNDSKTGRSIIIESERTKSEAGFRTLKMPEIVTGKLRQYRKWQMVNYARDREGYCKEYIGYICVNQNGKRLHPGYVTKQYRKHLIDNNFRVVRFHDLRHSCGAFFGRKKYNVKAIQEWLGHGDPKSTMRYTHFDMSTKGEMAGEFQQELSACR